MNLLLRWWWPVFVALSLLIFIPNAEWAGMWPSGTLIHYYWGALAFLGGLVLELSLHPNLGFKDLAKIPAALWGRYRPILWIVLFSIVMAISSELSPNPIFSWTGAPFDTRDATLAQYCFMGIAILAFIRVQHDPHLIYNTLKAIAVTGLLLSIGALIEVFSGHGLYINTDSGSLPTLLFHGTGQMGGVFLLCGAAALLSYLHNRQAGWLIIFALNIYTMGLTINRASVLGLGIMLLAMLAWDLLRKQGQAKMLVWALLIVGVCIPVGWWSKNSILGISRGSALSAATVETRQDIWDITWKGVLKRPITGWGAGQFQRHWFRGISTEQAVRQIRNEKGNALNFSALVQIPNPDQDPKDIAFVFKLGNTDQTYKFTWATWRSHNVFLDVLVSWGFPGLALYLVGLLSILPKLGRNPVGWIVLAYHVYLFTWFVIPHTIGALWLLWGLALYLPTQPTRPETPTADPESNTAIGAS